MTTFPKCEPLSRWANASFASSKSKTRSITGLMLAVAIVRATSCNPSRLPTEMCRNVAPLANNAKKSIPGPLAFRKPMHAISPPGRNGAEGLPDRPGSAYFYDAVHAPAAGQGAHAIAPSRFVPVVHDLVRTELPQPVCLGSAGGCRDHGGAGRLCQLKRENRDSAGPLRQHGVAGANRRAESQRTPRSSAAQGNADASS
jgi:hypothetical protein